MLVTVTHEGNKVVEGNFKDVICDVPCRTFWSGDPTPSVSMGGVCNAVRQDPSGNVRLYEDQFVAT